MNTKKIIFSILTEIKKGEQEPKPSDYDLSIEQFGEMVQIMIDGDYIKNAGISRGGEGNKPLIVWLDKAKITMAGLNYLEENSVLAKTYKGLKEIRSWLPL